MKAFFKTNHIAIFLALVFAVTNINTAVADALQTKGDKFKGYQIKFDYEKYPKEREIGYQFYLDEISQYIPNIQKRNIGIDLYDIDDDGEKEIFVYVNGGDKCPRAGCPFTVLRKVRSDENTKLYKKIWWSPGGIASLAIYNAPKVLDSMTLGYHDIMFGKEGKRISIDVWKGDHYNLSAVID